MILKNISYWKIIGILTYLITAIYGSVASFSSEFFWDSVYGVVDWFTASIIYFFLGALIGLFIDFIIAKKKKKKFTVPLWTYLILGFWAFSVILVFIFIESSKIFVVQYLFFPFTFGIFLPAMAYDFFFHSMMKHYITKLVLNIIFLSSFIVWIWAYIKEKELLQKILLYFIFLVFLFGLSGCVRGLA